MHFFEKQRVDAAGVLGVKLQKALIFLGIVSLSAFFVGAAIPAIFSLLLLAIGFIGAYRRRPCLLSLYFWINVIIAILGIVAAISLMIAGSQARDMGAQSNGYSNESKELIEATPASPNHPTPNNSTHSNPPQYESSESYSYSSSIDGSFSDVIAVDNALIIILLILLVILSVLVSFFKIYSIVLAWKVRRLLLASPVLPVAKSSNNTPSNISSSTYPGYTALPTNGAAELETSVAVPETPVQNLQGQQMMYMPYPGSMMVNQYGQPVFYTYQPMNQQTPQ